MHMRSILAIARKDALDILLNKTTLSLLLSPLLLAVLFLGIGRLLGGHTTDVLIYDPGRSHVEQVIKNSFSDVRLIYVHSPEDVTAALGLDGTHKDTIYALGVIVPNNFDESLRASQYPQLGLYINGDKVNNIQRQLFVIALADYARNAINPQLPINLTIATVNPPPPANAGLDVSKLYAVAIVLGSLFIGSSLVPSLLAEEKEKKTLRILMVSPASFADVVAAKLLVGLFYQLALTLLAITIQGGFIGQVPYVLLFVMLGTLFSVVVGLVIGCFFQTMSATGTVSGMVSFLYIVPMFFVGLFVQLLPSNPFTPLVKILPTYYIASGVADAVSNQSTMSSVMLNGSIILSTAIVLFMIALWTLRRQAMVVGSL